jgi:hypothetical protein
MKQDLNGVRTPEDVVRRYNFEDIPVLVESTKQISLEIKDKVDSDKIISAINLSPEEATITADKIKLEGYTTINNGFSVDEEGNMKAKSGEIGGWSLNPNGLSNGIQSINNNGYSNIYTYADMVIIRNYLLDRIDLSETDITHYDLNGDGVVDSLDMVIMRKKILNQDIEENNE